MIAKPLPMNFFRTHRKEQSVSDSDAHDRELVRRIASRDESALQELYQEFGQCLYAFALRLTSDPAAAEDVVQDVLVAVWQTAGKYRGDGKLKSWLLGIVHHTALKSLRRRSINISEEMESSLPDHEPLPEEQVQASQQSQLIRRGLQELSPEHRSVLELVFYQGLSLQETAEVCGCPVGTVKSRLNYARQHLRRTLNRMEDIP